jgi:hypothetical protein
MTTSTQKTQNQPPALITGEQMTHAEAIREQLGKEAVWLTEQASEDYQPATTTPPALLTGNELRDQQDLSELISKTY